MKKGVERHRSAWHLKLNNVEYLTDTSDFRKVCCSGSHVEEVDEEEKKPGKNASVGENYPISAGRFARRIFSRRVLRSIPRIRAA